MKRTVALLGLVPPLLVGVAGTAYADAPTKAGWWNAATANGVALPQPTTASGDLHVAAGPTGPAAYAAVGYELAGQAVTGGLLTLKVVANTAVGTVAVKACPTKDDSWKGGDDQPIDSAPAYDCSKGSNGVANADGTSITFILDEGQLLGADTYSLALVPVDGAAPFTVDFAKPDATSLTPEVEEAAAPEAPAPAYVAPAPAPPPAMSGAAPLAAGTVTVPVQPAPAPAVAVPVVPAPQAAAAPAALAPAAASRPAEPVSNRERYIAGSTLALLSGFLVWVFQQQSRQPRLLGGMARKAGLEAAVVIDPRPRGIGRFAALRTTPARPLV
jgi:hypothetical protein